MYQVLKLRVMFAVIGSEYVVNESKISFSSLSVERQIVDYLKLTSLRSFVIQ